MGIFGENIENNIKKYYENILQNIKRYLQENWEGILGDLLLTHEWKYW